MYCRLYDRPRIAGRILEVLSPVFVDREGTEGVCRARLESLFLGSSSEKRSVNEPPPN